MDMNQLGQRIRRAREARNLSQEEFAVLVDKDQTAISAYENGKRRVSAVDLATFAEKLRYPIVYFYEGDFKPTALDDVLLNQFHKIPDASKEDVIAILERLVHILQRPQ